MGVIVQYFLLLITLRETALYGNLILKKGVISSAAEEDRLNV